MKILEVFGEPISSGGQETFVLNLIKHIDKSNLIIDLFTPYYCDSEVMRKEVRANRGKIFSFGRCFKPGGMRIEIFVPLFRFLRHNKYDVVHVHSGSLMVFVIVSFCAKLAGVKNIIVHSHCGGGGVKTQFIKFISYPIMRYCPSIYCACSEVAANAKFFKHFNVRLIKNGIDLSAFGFSINNRTIIRNKLLIRDDEFLLGHVGRFSYVKNHGFMVNLLEELVKRDMKVKLIFIGEGELFDDVKKMVIKKNLSEFVIFAGVLSNIPDYLSAMDCFILPSHWEGLPFVGVEAQASGLPVIASDKVSKELLLIESVLFLSLTNIEEWIDVIMNQKGKREPNSIEILRMAGYDIKKTAEDVKRLYMK